MGQNRIQRSIGVSGAVMTLVGLVVGISIYILPGQLAGIAGPAMLLSYMIAAVIALFACVVAAQLGSVLPVSGASYIAISRLLSPFSGFFILWISFGGAAIAVALLADGFAGYAVLVVPALSKAWVAPGVVLLLGLLNLMGAKDFMLGQTIMVVMFIGALSVLVLGSIPHIDRNLLIPFSPNGKSAVLQAVVPAFFSYTGFMLIAEISGDIRNPSRNIPLALAASFAFVAVIYSSVSFVIIGQIPWQELGASSTPIADVADRIFPGWLAAAIAWTAVAAAATSINSLLLMYSRDVLVLARSGYIPGVFAQLSRKHGEPYFGVIAITGLSLVGVFLGGSITQYASLIVMGVMILQVLVSIAVIRMPKAMPEQFANSAFKLKPAARWFFCSGLILSSTYFLIVGIRSDPKTVGFASIYAIAGILYYLSRKLMKPESTKQATTAIEAQIQALKYESQNSDKSGSQ